MTGHIHRLRQDHMLESLFTLMSTAEKQIHIVNSIPAEVLDELAGSPGGGRLLAGYLFQVDQSRQ